nr:hypothetical protein [uncultured Rhodoferax sp.]
MPFTVQLGTPPQGISLNSAQEGETVRLAWRDFSSSEDGDLFIARLEDYPSHVLRLIGSPAIKPSAIDHFLFLIKPDGECTVYVNELIHIAKVRIRKNVSKGDQIYSDDILDIEELRFDGVEIPQDVGVFVLLSNGWRKGMYFDLGPLWSPPIQRDYDIGKLLGGYLNYLTYQQIFKITEKDWEALLAVGWFPFIGLKTDTIAEVLNHIRNGWNPDRLVENIYTETAERVHLLLEHWRKSPVLAPHRDILTRAIERFAAQDFISCVSILYPRLEGLLRSIASHAGETNFSQSNLAEAPARAHRSSPNTYSRLLPQRFREFLSKVFFKSFDPNDSRNPAEASRHTIAHGVAAEDGFNQKASLLAILMIEQIVYHLPASENLAAEAPSAT